MKRSGPGVVTSGMIESLEPRRFLSAGDLDPTFGVAGRADVGGAFQSVFAQPDGSVIVWRSDVNVDRFNADGSLAGHVQFTGGAGHVASQPSGVTPLPSGKFLVIGLTPGTTEPDMFQLERHHADGSLDTTFGDNGVGHDTAGATFPPTLALQNDGKILAQVAGGLLRLNANGSADSTFTPASLPIISFMRPQADGKILLLSSSNDGNRAAAILH